jgi:hypothetical protein
MLIFAAASAALAQVFTPVDTNFAATRHYVPGAPVQSKILFRGAVDTVTTANGTRALSRSSTTASARLS